MPRYRTPFSHLSRVELKALLVRIAAYALRKLGSRAGHGPDMDPEELTQRAIADTLEQRRRWNRDRCPLEQHLIGCINSYISHYFESRAARAQAPPTAEGLDPAASLTEHTTPEDILNQALLSTRIRAMVHSEDDPLLAQVWELLEAEGWDLKHDGQEFCQRLGLDHTSGSADYQRFNRLRNRLRNITRNCTAVELQGSAGTA
jgi:DNA-directed RNA polymerase specialized sigma24 family protein